MTELTTAHRLSWQMDLTEEGYTTWELVDGEGRRWGWIVNAGELHWTAHTGSWSQAELPVEITQKFNSVGSAAEGRAWIEQQLAWQWKDLVRARVNSI